MAVKAKDKPISEITLRKYEPPYKMTKRERIKKLCLSLGLLQPGDSRDVIVDILHIIINKKKGIPFGELDKELISRRERAKLPVLGVTPSNVHRQLRRLKELGLVEKHLDAYRLAEKMTIKKIFEERIIKYHLDSIVTRVREYVDAI